MTSEHSNSPEVELDAALDALATQVEEAIETAEHAEAAVEETAGEAAGAADLVEAEADAAAEAEAAAEDPYAAFKRELRAKPGKWYVVHSYAGYERKVKSNLWNRR